MIDQRSIVVVDTETTGPNPFVHELLAVAMVPMDRTKPHLELYVSNRGQVHWNRFARNNFQNFRSSWVQNATDVKSAAEKIGSYLSSLAGDQRLLLAGHNVSFDRAFLQKLAFLSESSFLDLVSHRTLDSHSLVLERVLKGRLPASCLSSDGLFKFFGAEPGAHERHTALGDATATRTVLERLLGDC